MKNLKDIESTGFWSRKMEPLKRPFRPLANRYRAYAYRHPKKAKAFLILGSLFAAGLGTLALFIALIMMGVFGHMPSQKDLRNINQNLASEVYTEDGVLLGRYFVENRLPANLEDISPNIINALISTEDARFFEHGGVDFRAAMRVIFKGVLGGDESAGGGSTLSQQLAKNLYPRKRLGFLTVPVAKVKEMVIASRLENIYSKNELLGLYLNTVPFSDNVFGIRVACKRFFDTTPKEIKTEQAAVLVGMLKATTAYNPRSNPDNAKERRNVVLSQMVKYQKLDQVACDSLKKLPIILKYTPENQAEGIAGYFREHLRKELEEELKKHTRPDGRPYNLYADGLKIYTTIDSRMQKYAEEVVQQHMKELQKTFINHFKGYRDAVPYGSEELVQQQKQASDRYKSWKEKGLSEMEIDSLFHTDSIEMTIFSWNAADRDTTLKMTPLDSIKYHLSLLQAGFLAAEPQTGKIKAWVGGIDFKHFQYDHVTALRQVGSTFKPVVYATAIERGIDPCERFPNDFITYRPEDWSAPSNGQKYENWSPRNVDGMYGGSYSMRGAVQMSVNSVAAQVIVRKTGIEPVRQMAQKMGISSNIPFEPGIALGSVDATLYEMVRLFAAFPNQGKLPTLYGISHIETPDGKVLADYKAPNPLTFPQVISKTTADVIVQMLRAVIDGGTGGRLRYICNFRYPAGGKTGTTDNNSDGWFMGFTPHLVFGAWVGAGQPLVRWRSTRVGQGGVSALPLAGHFLTKVYSDPAFKSYTENYGEFPRSPDADRMLSCANFIAPDPVAVDSLQADSLQTDTLQGNIIKQVNDLFNKNKEGEDGITRRDKKYRIVKNEKLERESERIKKHNTKVKKKRQRQKNRKEFFDGLLGKN